METSSVMESNSVEEVIIKMAKNIISDKDAAAKVSSNLFRQWIQRQKKRRMSWHNPSIYRRKATSRIHLVKYIDSILLF